VARCTKIINADSDDPKYIINVKQFAKFVVDLADSVAPTDIEEGMRVGVDRNKYQIHIPLPSKIDPTVTMMQVEEKPDVTYSDVGGCKEQIEKLREVVETPLLHVSIAVRYSEFSLSLSLSLFLSPPPSLIPFLIFKRNEGLITARKVCQSGHRAAERSFTVWTTGYRQDFMRTSGSQQDRCLFHTRYRFGVGSEIRWRGRRVHSR
jgi:hypothetical protein